MEIKKITKEDSFYINWLLQKKNNGLEADGLSEVCKILIEKINQLIEERDSKETTNKQSNCIEADVSVSLLERAEMLISDTHEYWHRDYDRWRNER